MPRVSLWSCSLLSIATVALSGCLATAPTTGGDSGSNFSGAAAGGTTQGENSGLEKCDEALGTLRIEENTNASWYTYYHSNYRLGSTVPVLRTMIQQSNCFVIVERGRAMGALASERAIMRSEEGRAGSNFGGGQVAAADYTLSPEIILSDRQNNGAVSAAGNLARGTLGRIGSVFGAVAGSVSTNEASTVLLLIDNRSSVQIAASEGYSKNTDFGLASRLFEDGTSAGARAYGNTPQGKVIISAFVDSYNNMVRALRNYKAQTVKGGLGTGGRLGVQGGQTEAGKKIK